MTEKASEELTIFLMFLNCVVSCGTSSLNMEIHRRWDAGKQKPDSKLLDWIVLSLVLSGGPIWTQYVCDSLELHDEKNTQLE